MLLEITWKGRRNREDIKSIIWSESDNNINDKLYDTYDEGFVDVAIDAAVCEILEESLSHEKTKEYVDVKLEDIKTRVYLLADD